MPGVIERANRANLEATLPASDLREYIRGKLAAGYRFRVENSRVGNSMVVTYKQAQELVAEYGGEIVEILESQHAGSGRDLPDCPVCGVVAGVACVVRTYGCRSCESRGGCPGHIRAPHVARKALVRDWDADVVRVPCPDCGREEQRYCVTPSGRAKRAAHRERIRLFNDVLLSQDCPQCPAGVGVPCAHRHALRVDQVTAEAARSHMRGDV